MFRRVLVANRGEIAVRIARTCHDLGVEVVAVFSDLDARALHVELADRAVHLPGASPTETYLNVGRILEAAERTGAEAIHPGYGFLSERADAAERVAEAGLVWVGPPASALRLAGDKVGARRLAESVGVPAVPGTRDPISGPEDVVAFGREHGFPVVIKAAGGGGGRGLKVVRSPEDAAAAFESAVREAEAYFGYGEVYLERYLERPKHIEVQVLAPAPGRTLWLGARDCSLQRRHQKLVEETPPPRFAEVVPALGRAAAAVADACGYVNAGTVEFLVDEDGRFYFLEVNARLQVEHTVTEELLGLDLVACQLRVAAGEPLGFDQADLAPGGRFEPRGHVIECRINAEDPARGFLPVPGRIGRYREPAGPGVRVDSGYREGDEVPVAYDSLLAKLVVRGADREEARRRALRALGEFVVEGLPTTAPAHRLLLEHPQFVDGSYTTETVEGGALDALMGKTVAAPTDTREKVLVVGGSAVRLWHPAVAASVAAGTPLASGDGGAVVAPMQGTVLKVLVREGEPVRAGDPVAVLETMKMETQVASPSSGVVREVRVGPGSVVQAGDPLALIGRGEPARPAGER
ncbi:MAG TPA: biotin carboxylase N-terminal domain-containing protein [Actinomycetota bacterium]|nr:biotin carboxylase N-terminal domain-containing protein [Actinomycetota bacterium]